jgi:predicted metal-binding protein
MSIHAIGMNHNNYADNHELKFVFPSSETVVSIFLISDNR